MKKIKTIIITVSLISLSFCYFKFIGIKKDSMTYINAFEIDLIENFNPEIFSKQNIIPSGELINSRITFMYSKENKSYFQITFRELKGRVLLDASLKTKRLFLTKLQLSEEVILLELKKYLKTKGITLKKIEDIKLSNFSEAFKQANQNKWIHLIAQAL